MEKTDRELLIKEISSRLPYGIKAQVFGWDEEKGEVKVPLRIYSINTDGYVYFETNDYEVNYLNVEGCLLYLCPMSSMTEEEKHELLRFGVVNLDKDNNAIDVCCVGFSNHAKVQDYLNSIHIDYRGLIPKGLAIEVIEKNNPYKE